ncbi:ImmA/IrrE family metallo-endopeptidase [Cryobacterium sp. TMT4-31]|uniref:ImmA/IrrE family metallo-endopeptidase n=1 Tax=Cryobacterium sp. TMT4-31 TaxID=1259259 RepID=UPI00106A2BDF|nr:ImmA/IrrE family metallo-endopeptidase [Cryobacterium sp. TMT4-31]TFC92879.1 ImmA/IrrE family metallo-endopeptidase [Cryobacterium sp. TMT4-31]
MSDVLIESPLSNRAISEYAERVGTHHGIYSETGQADLKRLIGILGGHVDVSPSVYAGEALSVRTRGDFTVHLPPMTSDRRDRFTMAHELGHYFLHYLQPAFEGPRTFGRGTRNKAETQANFFAASLLMPADKFKASHAVHGSDWWAVANVFGVSPKAAEVRAQVLGI